MAEEQYEAKIVKRVGPKVTIQIRDKEEIWETVRDFEFTSARKMMSVVARRINDNEVKCFCKGADEVVQTRLTNVGIDTQNKMIEQIQTYAEKGLRTLMFTYRNVGEEEL